MRQLKNLSQGAEITRDGVTYRTWATGKKVVSTVITDEAGTVVRELPMKLGEDGYYSVADPESGAGTFYQFRLDGDCFPDMASRFQPKGVHGPSQVINPHSFGWTDSTWKAPQLTDLVIYETHIGTFTREGTYESLVERFDHLLQLGVNAIEIMPIADFAGERNWGYDGVFLFAPAHDYGHPDGFRTLVNAAHNVGLAVILDVVYNHLGPDGNYLGSYSKNYFNDAHHTPWGSAFNLDKPDFKPVRTFFSENPIYWMEEFHIDGFRLDATHAIPDDSPKHLIQEIAESVQERGGLVICEDPRNDRMLILPRDQDGYGCDAVWADDFHHVVRVQMTGENEGYLSYFTGSMKELMKTLREGWLFSGDIQKDGIPRGTNGSDLEPERFVHCISNHDQVGNKAFGTRLNHIVTPAAYRAASALLLTAPYSVMLFMGQEWAASSPFLYFTDHYEELGKGITEGRRKEFADFSEFNDPKALKQIPDPQALTTFEISKLLWNELSNSPHAETLRLYTDLLRFRRTNLSNRHRESWHVDQVSNFTVALRYHRESQGDVLILSQLVTNKVSIPLEHKTLRPAAGKTWRFTHSSNESIYGGVKTGTYDPVTQTFELDEPEVIIFSEANTGELL
jgi:maltooligosyltrehalose trehalohydrolase